MRRISEGQALEISQEEYDIDGGRVSGLAFPIFCDGLNQLPPPSAPAVAPLLAPPLQPTFIYILLLLLFLFFIYIVSIHSLDK
jgi:hypothetical protein